MVQKRGKWTRRSRQINRLLLLPKRRRKKKKRRKKYSTTSLTQKKKNLLKFSRKALIYLSTRQSLLSKGCSPPLGGIQQYESDRIENEFKHHFPDMNIHLLPPTSFAHP